MRVLQSCVILVHIASLFNQQASASDSDSGSDNGSHSGSKSVNIGTPERKLTECVDDPVEWYDIDGPFYNCAWYGAVSSHCTMHGNSYANFGRTANEACCVCGGGVSSAPIALRAVEVLGDCARDQSCDSPATNNAVTWFTNPDNHLVDNDDDWDDQVWRERLVLAILYYEMSGDQWYDNTNWLTPSHHRLWYGVGYTNYVDELDLNSNNLIGSIPAQISILTSLTYLSFSNKKKLSCCNDCDSPDHPSNSPAPSPSYSPLLSSTAVEVLGECAIDQSCDYTAKNSAVTWFFNPDNHPDNLGTDEQVWKERLLLAIFYYSTSGDQWWKSANWLDANDHSTWYGVTTDSSTNYVEELNLEGNALSGSIPAEGIGHLTSLTILYLANNDLKGTIPAEIGHLTSLTRLYLFGNALSGSIPAEIGNLTSLDVLSLHFNDLTGSIPDGVCDWPSAYLYADCKNCDQSKPDCCYHCD